MIIPTVIIDDLGDGKWHFKMKTHIKDLDDEFVIGQEFDDVTGDGRKVKSLYKIDGNKLIHEHRDPKTGEWKCTAEKFVNEEDKMEEVYLCCFLTLSCRNYVAIYVILNICNRQEHHQLILRP